MMIEELAITAITFCAAYFLGYRSGRTKGQAEGLGEAHAVWSMVIHEAAQGKDTIVLKIKSILEK